MAAAHDHWEKDAPGAAGFVATPRVERVFRIMPSPLLREAHAAYSLAVGNPRNTLPRHRRAL